MLNKGDTLGGTYVIEDIIGAGGGGVIYKAYHQRIKKSVAIKLIKDSAKNVISNRAEVDLLKNLKHEFLPQIIDFIEVDGDVYTIMDFVEGKDFKKVIESGRTFSNKEIIKFAKQLLSAVEYLHSQNPPIIHSDIKPANVMLTPNGNICLIDFNISTVSFNGGGYGIGGSRGFAAPEQFKKIIEAPIQVDEFKEETRFVSDDDVTEILSDNENGANSVSSAQGTPVKRTKNVMRAYIDTRTDIYSIGATLYYILTSRVPTNGRIDFRGINAPNNLKKLITKAMNPDPDKRYKNISEMQKELNSDSQTAKTLRIIAMSVAAVFILAIGMPSIKRSMEIQNALSDKVSVYGMTYTVSKSPEKEFRGGKVDDVYSATAVSVAKCVYEYLGRLDIQERYAFLNACKDEMTLIEQAGVSSVFGDISAKNGIMADTCVLGSGSSDDPMFQYIIDNAVNYTNDESLFIYLSFSDKTVSKVYVCSENSLRGSDEITFTIDGKVGYAITKNVQETTLSDNDKLALENELVLVKFESDSENVVNNLEESIVSAFHPNDWEEILDGDFVEINGSKYGLSTEQFKVYTYDITDGGDISALADLPNLITLSAESTEIMNFDAFPVLPNLKNLNISWNMFKNLDGIDEKFPNLEMLNLYNNEYLDDISALAKLKNLSYVNLTLTKVSDLTPLKSLTNLREIFFETPGWKYNSGTIVDINDIVGIPLERLTLSDMVLTNIDKIGDISTLKYLSLDDIVNSDDTAEYRSNYYDIDFMSKLTYLEELKIVSNDKITSVTPLGSLPNLRKIELVTCGYVTDISALAGLSQLEYLDLGINNGYESELYAKAITDTIGKITSLEYLDIEGSVDLTVSGTNFISNLKKLKVLKVSSYSTSDYYNPSAPDFSPIANLTKLEEFDSGYQSHLKDVSFLKNCKSLRVLKIYNDMDDSDCKVNLSVLAEVNDLEVLTLSYVDISDDDVEYIMHLTNLKELNVTGEHISPENIAKIKESLPECNVHY